MNYWEHTKSNLPIGSGVTEASLQSGSKTKIMYTLECNGKNLELKRCCQLRTLILTKDRWQQYWAKINTIWSYEDSFFTLIRGRTPLAPSATATYFTTWVQPFCYFHAPSAFF